ncbi:hypothetical protein BKA70DRAFT_1238314 [Coprinopsis sp. MPI-PUGE-AT-0042]|nr:hypothetical protein BKA70DRAFT_1238314 [Coprinopsis sp. MPI-PUGE-AT-0042]
MSTGLDNSNLNLPTRKRERSPMEWDLMTVSREGGLQYLQSVEALSQTTLGKADNPPNRDNLNTSDSAMAEGLQGGVPIGHRMNPNAPSASSEYFTTSRSVTVIRRHHKEMSKEEIIRAKDAVIRAQRQRIERLQRRIRELKEALYSANRVQALTMNILEVSLEFDTDVVL